MNIRVGVGDVAGELRLVVGRFEIAEGFGGRISVLRFALAEVDAATVESRGCPCFHAPGDEPVCAELTRDAFCGPFSGSAALELLLSEVNPALKESAGSEDGALAVNLDAQLCFDALNQITFNDELGHHVLPQVDVGVRFEGGAPLLGKGVPVVLGSGGPHGWTLRAVEHAELNGAAVRDTAAHTAERIDFAQDLSFGHAAHSRVAAHGADGGQVHRDEQDLFSQCGRGVCGFVAGVSATDHDDVVVFKHGVVPRGTWG